MYQYAAELNTYVIGENGEYHSTDIMEVLPSIGGSSGGSTLTSMLSTRLETVELWPELIPDTSGGLISDMVYEQYELVSGK